MKELEGDVRASIRAILADHDAADVVPALVKSGFDELLDENSRLAAGWYFEEQGYALATSAALDLVVGRALGVDVANIGIGYPIPGSTAVIERLPAGPRAVSALVMPGFERSDHVAVLRHDEGCSMVVTVQRPPLNRYLGERAAGWGRIDGTFDAVDVTLLDGSNPWLSLARIALSHELLGVARLLLEHAIAHTSEREQFGRPIAVHQTVRHRLADSEVAIQSVDALLGADTDGDGAVELFAATAKAFAGRTALLVADHAQQLCGGLGFTRESLLHHAVDRVHLLGSFLGSYPSLRSQLGRRLLAEGNAPRMFGLASGGGSQLDSHVRA